jgi:8-oxo-dGTP pyrophosphatase MutT (NUDIX family)
MARSCSWSASSACTWPREAHDRRALKISAARETSSGQIPAAVLVPLFLDARTQAAHVVLTRRRTDLRRHAGEISFPGGRQDPHDEQLRDTALREAEEEIGLDRSQVDVLGELTPVSTFATNYLIHPFVGTIPAPGAWRPSPLEVDAVLELPLRAVREGRTRTRLERRGISFETDAYVVDEHLIWGATARIIAELLERADAFIPRPRPARPRGSPTPSRSRRSS